MWKKNPTSNLRPRLDLANTFWAILLMIGFEDLILIFHIWVPNIALEGIMKNFQLKQHFATTFRHLTNKIMVLVYQSIFSDTWPCLLPSSVLPRYYP